MYFILYTNYKNMGMCEEALNNPQTPQILLHQEFSWIHHWIFSKWLVKFHVPVYIHVLVSPFSLQQVWMSCSLRLCLIKLKNKSYHSTSSCGLLTMLTESLITAIDKRAKLWSLWPPFLTLWVKQSQKLHKITKAESTWWKLIFFFFLMISYIQP